MKEDRKLKLWGALDPSPRGSNRLAKMGVSPPPPPAPQLFSQHPR